MRKQKTEKGCVWCVCGEGVHTTSAFTKQYILFIVLFLYSDKPQLWCNGYRSGHI
jgi:hypothetical protein